jgi:hypothetical protein
VTCPQCGAPAKRKTNALVGLLAFVIVVAACAGICTGIFSLGDKTTGGAATEEGDLASVPEAGHQETRKERIERQFSVWDGSHRGLTKTIKDAMNDPRSYEHVETVSWDQGDYLVVRTTFRGKNAFGGVVKNWIKAKVDLDGNVIAILEQGP